MKLQIFTEKRLACKFFFQRGKLKGDTALAHRIHARHSAYEMREGRSSLPVQYKASGYLASTQTKLELRGVRRIFPLKMVHPPTTCKKRERQFGSKHLPATKRNKIH